MNDIAIIGAGISGLTCARSLSDAGCNVVVFEKSRGSGGRVATRRTDLGNSNLTIVDHGAQYFTVRDERMAEAVERWRQCGVVALWEGKIGASVGGTLTDSQPPVERWVGTPTMSAIGKFLAQGLDVRLDKNDKNIEREYTGTYDEVRQAIKSDKELPRRQQQHLLRNLDNRFPGDGPAVGTFERFDDFGL